MGLRIYQQKAIDAVSKNLQSGIDKQLLCMATGCHAKDTVIIMVDGTTKLVQDIVVGDKLMGDDGTERNVLNLARGNEKMYKVIPIKGNPFVVNQNHILSLKRTGCKREKDLRSYPNIIENISIINYINRWSKSTKHAYKLYRASELQFYNNVTLEVDPYWVGLWIGDGNFGAPIITKDEPELDEYFKTFTYKNVVCTKRFQKDRCSNYSFTTTIGQFNPLKNFIKKFTKSGEKRIIPDYLYSAIENRLKLLAGLLDTDGYLNRDGSCYEIITKYKGLSEDILFLVRSLGLSANISNKIGKIKSLNFEGLYYRINISGHTNKIPCKISRKIANPRQQKKDVLVTGFSLEELENDDFYGFALDGNHLYLTGDFTVHHNTGKTKTAIGLTEQVKFKKTLWLTHRDDLCNQSALAFIRDKFDERFSNHVDELGFIKYINQGGLFAGGDFKMGLIKGDIFKPDGDVVVASANTIHNRLHLLKPDQYDCLIIDECHRFGSKSLYKGLSFFEPKLRLGLSATPFRDSGVLMGDIDITAFEYNLQEAIKDGNLCELDGVRIKTNLSLDNVHTLGGEFNQKELADEVNCYKRNLLIVNSYIKYCRGIQGIFFCVNINHCLALLELFMEAGINAKAVSSDEKRTPNSAEHIKAYKKGQIDVLINVDLLTVGTDAPNTGCIGCCAPTKSLVKFLQLIGRGTRLKDKIFVSKYGQKCIVLDFLDNTTRHNIINTWTLDYKLPPEERIFLTSENRNRLVEERLRRNSKVDIKKNFTSVQRYNYLFPDLRTCPDIFRKPLKENNSVYGFLNSIVKFVYT